jgi:hypothetical protein
VLYNNLVVLLARGVAVRYSFMEVSKMKRVLLVTGALFLANSLPNSAANGEENARGAAKLFIGYPKSDALNSVIKGHTNKSHWTKHLLYATWFLDGKPNVMMQCRVNQTGQVTTERDVYNWAYQGGGHSQLKPQSLKSLRQAVRALPPSTQSPAMANLLILSFRNGGDWTTRTYDRAKLPEAVKKIYKITGAPIETIKA